MGGVILHEKLSPLSGFFAGHVLHSGKHYCRHGWRITHYTRQPFYRKRIGGVQAVISSVVDEAECCAKASSKHWLGRVTIYQSAWDRRNVTRAESAKHVEGQFQASHDWGIWTVGVKENVWFKRTRQRGVQKRPLYNENCSSGNASDRRRETWDGICYSHARLIPRDTFQLVFWDDHTALLLGYSML